MIVGVDLRCLPTDGSAGAGVAHAARFLTEELLKKDVLWEWRLYVSRGAGASPCAPTQIIELPNASGASLRRELRAHPCDVLFVPGGSVAPFLSVPAIPWVHDLAIFDHPEWFPQSRFRRFMTTTMFRRGVKKAPFVFAVSEETKRQIVTKFHIAPENVVVTLEGGDPLLTSVIPAYSTSSGQAPAGIQPRPAGRPGLDPRLRGDDKRYVLFLGTIEPRKNLSTLLNAWKLALQSLPNNLELLIVGRDGWRCEDVIRDIEKTPRVRRIVDCDDDQRRALLRSADLVVVPSLYEGFGLVALEAMQAGTPLIASNAGSLPEVVGDGGMLIDPNDVRSWAEAMRSLAVDDAKRQHLAQAGSERAKDFSWDKTAEVVVEQMKKRS